MKLRRYHSLLARDDATSPWGIEFGDYDRETVEHERDDMREGGRKRSDMKIVTTGDKQADIYAAVERLNSRNASV